MEYKIILSNKVESKILRINDYWINKLNNTGFTKMFFDEYLYIKSLICLNPRMYSSYGEYYRIKMRSLNYNLFYEIVDDTIIITDIKHTKENQ